MTGRLALACCLCVVLAGCAAPVVDDPADDPADATAAWPDDPERDVLGWEQGVWYNESIDVTQADGLTEREREVFVARTMARVERLRGLEFERPVPVEVVSRRAYRNDTGGVAPAPSVWNDQVWEALFLVGEDRTVSEVFAELYGGSVLGYYSPSEDRIVVVSDSETPTIDRRTLAHELVHALQDQHLGFGAGARTQDAQLAQGSVVEGDARYVDRLYEERCADGWECVPTPPADGGGGGVADRGVYTAIYTPYSEGPTLVVAQRERGGWNAVNRLYDRVPASTEQVIHVDAYPHERPVAIAVPDRSGPGWSRLDHTPVGDTVGEASLFVMLWDNGVIPRSHLNQRTGPYSAYNYSHPATAGWAGDTVVPYRSDAGAFGYVFRSRWDTVADARQFAAAYHRLLTETHGAVERGDGVYVVPEGPYADAFRVERRGTTVTVVNAPTREALGAVHAS